MIRINWPRFRRRNYSVITATLLLFGVFIGQEVQAQKPVFSTHPKTQMVCAGYPATFSVMVGGANPMSYQWRFNGEELAGATQSAYTLPNVQPEHGGIYSVVASNLFGTATSSNALLNVGTVAVGGTGAVTNVPLDLTNAVSLAAGASWRACRWHGGCLGRQQQPPVHCAGRSRQRRQCRRRKLPQHGIAG